MNTELLKKMQEKLEQAGIPFEELKVFGAIRCNVHVVCIGRETAQKWAQLLAQVFGVKPYLGAHAWNAKVNRNTCMLPTLRKGFLVTIAA
jgi:hypothetical protein